MYEDKRFVYATGSDKCNGKLYIVKMNNLLNPFQAGCDIYDTYGKNLFNYFPLVFAYSI